jgi:outer membrane immunogenic protein
MRKVRLYPIVSVLFGAAVGISGVGAARAADLPARTTPYSAPYLSPAPVATWSGLYAGVHLGGAGGSFNNHVPTVAGPINEGGGVMGGGQVGYNWQINQLVFGIEADISGIDISASTAPNSFNEDWMATVRGRAGYAWDRYLAYATLGVGFTHVEVQNAVGSADKVQAGVAVGVGLEAVLWSPQWRGRIEYLYVDVPTDSYFIGAARFDGGSDNHIGRVALNYRFW